MLSLHERVDELRRAHHHAAQVGRSYGRGIEHRPDGVDDAVADIAGREALDRSDHFVADHDDGIRIRAADVDAQACARECGCVGQAALREM
jgi:hypothetical protein